MQVALIMRKQATNQGFRMAGKPGDQILEFGDIVSRALCSLKGALGAAKADVFRPAIRPLLAQKMGVLSIKVKAEIRKKQNLAGLQRSFQFTLGGFTRLRVPMIQIKCSILTASTSSLGCRDALSYADCAKKAEGVAARYSSAWR
jgi:hypothetical protein